MLFAAASFGGVSVFSLYTAGVVARDKLWQLLCYTCTRECARGSSGGFFKSRTIHREQQTNKINELPRRTTRNMSCTRIRRLKSQPSHAAEWGYLKFCCFWLVRRQHARIWSLKVASPFVKTPAAEMSLWALYTRKHARRSWSLPCQSGVDR